MSRKYQNNKKTIEKISPEAKTQSGTPRSNENNETIFPIIGIGASAGGLDALKKFFSNTSLGTGNAYIVVIHMTPEKKSLMPELLEKVTELPVSEAVDGEVVLPDHIYINPPGKEISLYHGEIQSMDIVRKGLNLPIDFFLKSLAKEKGPESAAVILSGTGTDGTSGLKEINANGGLVLVQSEDSAEYDGMPRSAISTGLVDIVLPPEEMPAKLYQYFSRHQPELESKRIPPIETDQQKNSLNKIFAILRVQVGHDFSGYKVNTLLRRLSRRMGLNQISSLEQYVSFLRENPEEVESLFRELLIGVTSFFRDPESFEYLKDKVLPQMLEHLADNESVRVWIPGCSTGEEVYSLAILFSEYIDRKAKRINLRLFGTDIDDKAIEKAREGRFPASIAADVSQERLTRFFTKEGDFYQVCKNIRDCVVFSVQNLIIDPPFSRLNLLCCRNLLIYLESKAQKKILPLFHYTLLPKGFLMLGTSESIGEYLNLFNAINRKWKIYQRQEVPLSLRKKVDFPNGIDSVTPLAYTQPLSSVEEKNNIGRLTQESVQQLHGPTSLLIDKSGHILHVLGRTGKYLETTTGPPSQNILDMAREGLRLELSAAIRKARSSNRKVTRDNIVIGTNSERFRVTLYIYPVQMPQELTGRLIVVFEDTPEKERSVKSNPEKNQDKKESSKIFSLERELLNTRESHQTVVEELESTNEELKSTNEELQSSNEELQSTNEELESSKEELQSLNEELHVVNSELQSKVEELSAIRDDMRNLLNSTQIATIFVDNNLCIHRYTPMATAIINLIPSDIGRPLQHVMSNLLYKDMIGDLEEVLEQLTTKETEVQAKNGKWYNMRIMIYRTADNRIDGAVLTFVDIDTQKNKAKKSLN